MSFLPPEGEQNATAALELCSLGTMHIRLGLPPGWVIRNWRDWDQGFARGSRRVLGSCKQEKRSARFQREESGCPKEEGGKRPCKGKKKAQKLTKAKWERGRGETERKRQCGSSTDPVTKKNTEKPNHTGPSAGLTAYRENWRGLGFSHQTTCPWMPR